MVSRTMVEVGAAESGGHQGAAPAHAEPVARAAPALGRGSWLWRGTFVVFLVAAVVAIPVLTVMGKHAVEDSTSGRLIGVVTDPAAPGYEVMVEPSPTLLLVQTDGESLDALTFLALSSPTTGSALFIPPNTTIETAEGPTTLRDQWEIGGERGLTAAVEQLLGVGIAEFADDGTMLSRDDQTVVRLDRSDWAQLVDPVAPIATENPSGVEVTDDDGALEVRFPAGEVALEADQVGTFLAARGDGENDLNRMERHQRFWEGWIEAVRESPAPDAVPGEVETGLGRFVRAFADGEAGFVPVQASTYRIPGADDDVYLVDADWLDALVPAMVPFPTSPAPGARPVVEVLDGTGTPGASLAVANDLARAGAEIRMIGNGPTFDYVGTQILYYSADQEAAAEAMREALGTGTIELRENPDEVVAVTVIFGTDVVEGLDL
jgi:hypothetical protein